MHYAEFLKRHEKRMSAVERQLEIAMVEFLILSLFLSIPFVVSLGLNVVNYFVR